MGVAINLLDMKKLRSWTTAIVACAVATYLFVQPATLFPDNMGVDTTTSRSLDLLGSLSVSDRAPKKGYSREMFGQAWSDDVSVIFGHNGCDTRNDILRRDLFDSTLKANTHGCVVQSGTLRDPYTGETIEFTRKPGTSTVQIDHVVALGNAWVTGAQLLSDEQRRQFANDPLNLLAVSTTANMQKSDSDAANWLPANEPFRCAYVARQLQVKARYGLWVTPAEKAAIEQVLHKC